MKRLCVDHKVVPTEHFPLEGVSKQNLLQTKHVAKALAQYAHPEENLNDVHVNINRVDLSVMKELVN